MLMVVEQRERDQASSKISCRCWLTKAPHGHASPCLRTWHSARTAMADHDHTHAPGEEHSHSHGPETPQSASFPALDPTAQAVLDQDFVAVPLALHPDPHSAVCAPHKLEKCDKCNVDFVNTNRLSRLLVANPGLLCPPPNNVVSQQLTQMVQRTKDEGNVRSPSLDAPSWLITCIGLLQARPGRPSAPTVHCSSLTSRPTTAMGG